MAEPRPYCLRCRRAQVVCVCGEIRAVPSRTRVIFVQHPREARVPISTCRLAHLSLPNSELHVGVGAFVQLAWTLQSPGAVLLFPSPEAGDVATLSARPSTVVVVDGTWTTARKLMQRCPILSALPRIGFSPTQPSNYRIRREPAAHCVSTIEAVVHVLDTLEGTPGRFTPMLTAFDRMVDLQLAHYQSNRSARPATA